MKKLWRKVIRKIAPARAGIRPLRRYALREANAIITVSEVTDRHGTGVILSRIFGESRNILSIRSGNHYGEHSLGAAEVCVSQQGFNQRQSLARMSYALNGSTICRVLCVPYLADELISALVLKEMFGAPLCTYVMDDNNVYSHGIPDELMREALSKSTLRLAISPEMREEYERKYGLKFWILPPVVRAEAVPATLEMSRGGHFETRTAVMVGSLWSRQWLQQFRQTVRQARVEVHWYGNAQFSHLGVTPEELRQDGIVYCGFLPEAELTVRVKAYPYALIPSGTLDEQDDRPGIARLSLPTRLPHLLALTHTPMIVLGNSQTAAARFLERFGVGLVAPYDGVRLRQVVDQICRPEQQLAFRRRAAGHSALFSAKGLAEWVWQSLAQGRPCDERFERAFTHDPGT